MKRVLVTGASGGIESAIVKHLVQLARLSRFKKNKPIFNELRPQTLLVSFKFCLG